MANFLRYLFCLLVVGILSSLSVAAQKAPPKPNGGAMPGRPKGPPSYASQTDLFNMGPIGARAEIQGANFIIRELLKDAPAKGLLNVGDLVVGAGGETFQREPRATLGAAIDAAEGSKKGELSLTVKRGGVEKKIKIKLPKLGKYESNFPKNCDKTDRILANACDWLVKNSAGGHWQTMMGNNGDVVVTALCGLALLATGESKYAAKVKAVAGWMKTKCGVEKKWGGQNAGGANHSQVNWNLGYGGIFLAEYYLATGDKTVVDKLKEIAAALSSNQEQSGGYAHGPGGPNALGYVEVNASTYACLIALALIRECGIKVDASTITRAQDYLQASSVGGRVGYSSKRGQKGMAEPGRTGGTLVAYKILGNREGFLKAMAGFLGGQFRITPEGHASQIIQMTFATLGSKMAGKRTYRTYMDHFKWYFDLARCPDGRFICQPNRETLKMGKNFDRSGMTDAWPTGAFALMLATGRENLRICGKKKGGKHKVHDSPKNKPDPDAVVTGKDRQPGTDSKPTEKKKKPKKKTPKKKDEPEDWDKILGDD